MASKENPVELKGSDICATCELHNCICPERQPDGSWKKSERYISQPGFETVDILRGGTEIEPLIRVVQNGGIICGGYVRWMCSPRKPKKLIPAQDIDVYCHTEEKFYQIKQGLAEQGLEIRHENNMAITYRVPDSGPFRRMWPVQLIKPVKEGRVVAVGKIEDILANFDFTIVRIGFEPLRCFNNTSSSEEIQWTLPTQAIADADFLHDEEKGILRLKNIHCPISSTLRCTKYSRKGFWLPPLEAMKLFSDWEVRTLEYKAEITSKMERIQAGDRLTQTEIDKLEEMMRVD